jgi:peptide deformylase
MYKIVTYPNPVLRRKADPIDEIDDDIRRVTDHMVETMYKEEGIGLAAPQVDVSKRLIVVDIGQGPIALFNPEIIRRTDEEETIEEGCLSLPGIRIHVSRPNRIVFRGLTDQGKWEEIEADGLLARVFQHEIDHLNGILIIDHASSIQRSLLRSKLRKLEKES